MARTTRSFRGISRRAAVMYLEGLGGEALEDGRVEGDGWSASIEAESVDIGPSLSLTEVTITFDGDAAALDTVVEQFERKAIRAGG